MKGDEKNHESQTVRSSGVLNAGNSIRSEPVVVSVLPQRGTLKDSKWREAFSALSDFSLLAYILIGGIAAGLWLLGVNFFLYLNKFYAVGWIALGVCVVLAVGYIVNPPTKYDVEKERAKTKKA